MRLSGTPFNLLDEHTGDAIYTWDYVMEQKAKRDWDILHKGDPNPYASLPHLNIFTFDLGKMLGKYQDEELAFNFHGSSELMKRSLYSPARCQIVSRSDL